MKENELIKQNIKIEKIDIIDLYIKVYYSDGDMKMYPFTKKTFLNLFGNYYADNKSKIEINLKQIRKYAFLKKLTFYVGFPLIIGGMIISPMVFAIMIVLTTLYYEKISSLSDLVTENHESFFKNAQLMCDTLKKYDNTISQLEINKTEEELQTYSNNNPSFTIEDIAQEQANQKNPDIDKNIVIDDFNNYSTNENDMFLDKSKSLSLTNNKL